MELLFTMVPWLNLIAGIIMTAGTYKLVHKTRITYAGSPLISQELRQKHEFWALRTHMLVIMAVGCGTPLMLYVYGIEHVMNYLGHVLVYGALLSNLFSSRTSRHVKRMEKKQANLHID